MDWETIVNKFILPVINSYVKGLITSQIVAVLKINVLMMKMGLSKTTVAIILLLM